MKRVYFIKPVGMDGPIKIGCSQSPDGRRETLETWSPFALEIVAEIEGDFDLESRFHHKFRDDHKGREWFNVTLAMAATIRLIKAGRFDVDALPPPKRLPRSSAPLNPETDGRFRKWTAEQKERARLWRREKQITEATGLVRDDVETLERFVADPQAYGVTPEERRRRRQVRTAQYMQERADEARVIAQAIALARAA